MLFSSFLMGGFEACFALGRDRRLDMLIDTCHEAYCADDYRLLRSAGIYTIRESLSWHHIDKGGGTYDFSRFEPMMRTARELDMEVIWSLNHFDLPEDLDAFSAAFPERFAAYAVAAVQKLRQYQPDGPLYIIPFNEISFFSWMAGDVGSWAPFGMGRGFELKVQLVRAVLAAWKRLKAAGLETQFIQVDPIIHRIPALDASAETVAYVQHAHAYQYQAWDMICGRMMPELGGCPEALGYLGINYYYYNQHEVTHVEYLPHLPHGQVVTRALPLGDPRRVGFDEMLQEVWDRYGAPMVITEAGAHGALRMPWWQTFLPEIERALERGLPLHGLCAYPVIDRPDWHGGHLTNSGFWDFETGDAACMRRPFAPLLELVQAFRFSVYSDSESAG